MSIIDEHIATFTPAQQTEFGRISRIVRDTVPAAEEGMSYAMPAFLYKGKAFIAFAAKKKHLSIYPFSGKVIDRLRDKLGNFGLSSGTIRFSEDNPIPEDLLKEIITARLEEIEQAIRLKEPKPR